MRILLLFCALSAASARNAHAIKSATQIEIDAIEAQFLIAEGMDEKIDLAKAKHEAASSNIETTRADLHALERDVERKEAKQRAARTKAIHMTILAYDLTPVHPSGKSVMRWTEDRTITWLPVAGEGEDRLLQNGNGRLKRRPSKKPAGDFAGVTYPDGVTYIPASTFKRGPGFLASVLLHERIHFEQYTTDGKGNAMSRSQRQEEAYQAQVDNEKYFFDPVKDEDAISEIKHLLSKEKEYVKREKGIMGIIRRYLPDDNLPDKAESLIHTNAELADISGLVAQARGHADIARREREERDARSRAAAEKTAHDERLKRTYVDMATRSCANPGSVTQTELNALADPYDKEFVGTPPRGLGACEYMAYMSLGRGADAEQLRRNSNQTASPAAQPVPPPFNPHLPADPKPARPVPGIRFSSQFPLLKDLAVKACNSPAQVSIARNQIHSSYMYSFDRGNDDRLAAKMSAEMDNCPRQVFNKLIEKIRSGQGSAVDGKWLRDLAAQYPAPVYVAPPRSSPPTGCIPGDNSRRNCIACGNTYCP